MPPKEPTSPETPAAPPAPAAPVQDVSGLPRAAETSDAGVHKLLADRQAHAASGNEEAVAAIDDEIRALGYEPA